MLKNRYLFFLSFLFSGSFAFSQSIQRYAFTSAGTNGYGPSSIQSNIGELMSSTYSNSSNYLSQGFVQNDQLFVNVNSIDPKIQLKAYPNPLVSILTIELSGADCSDIMVSAFDVLGKKQFQENKSDLINGKYIFELNFENLVSGIYFIRVYSAKNQFSQVFKITKA